MTHAYIALPTGEWLPLKDNEMHFDVIKRSGLLSDFKESEPDAYNYFKKLGYSNDEEISDEDEELFDNIEFEYKQRAVKHALKKGALRIRYFDVGDYNRNEKVVLIAGNFKLITLNIIEIAFIKFITDNKTVLSIEDCDGNEVFNGTYEKYKLLMINNNS